MARGLRLGLPALAIYALVLQAFLTGAAPAAAFNPANVLCAEVAAGATPSSSDAPAGQHHQWMCVAHCSAATLPVFTLARAAGLPPRVALLAQIRLATNEPAVTFLRHRGPGARAPPQA